MANLSPPLPVPKPRYLSNEAGATWERLVRFLRRNEATAPPPPAMPMSGAVKALGVLAVGAAVVWLARA